MAAVIDITDFIEKLTSGGFPLLDARSESEYQRGHIPGAINLPLLNNEERVVIGTCYKQQGREEAVKKGFELVGPRFAAMIAQAEQLIPSRKMLLYCWRGGMRSNIMAWLLNMAGFQVFLLKGGYKSYRNWSLQQFNVPLKMVVIGGKTGSGKTELLLALENTGEQVIDLEGLAHHKGSAFGALGQPPQYTTEHFENLLALKYFGCKNDRVTWIENDCRSVGSNVIPMGLYEQMRMAMVAEISLDHQIRKKRILNEYGSFPKEVLAENTRKVAKRLGGQRLKEALHCLEQNNMEGWVEIMLHYYDDTYAYSNAQRNKSEIISISLPDDSMQEQAIHVLNQVRQFMIHGQSGNDPGNSRSHANPTNR